MPTERTVDYDALRDLMRAHPDWGNRQLAAALTEHERKKDPHHPPVNVALVASIKHRYRDTWSLDDMPIPDAKNTPNRRSQPFRNVPAEYRYDGKLQNLRRLSRLERGEAIAEKQRREALSMARKLEESKQVVDVDFRGRPYYRRARPDELDGEGNLTRYDAKYPGLTDAQWKALGTPEARAIASAQWRVSPEALGAVEAEDDAPQTLRDFIPDEHVYEQVLQWLEDAKQSGVQDERTA